MEKKKRRQRQHNCCWCGKPFMAAGNALYCPHCREFIHNKCPRTRRQNTNSELLQDVRDYEAYNKENKTKLSYGQYKLMKSLTEKKGK